MALTGTLKDFGIADILQLIGQQRKSGVLHVEDKDQSIQIHFSQGSIVRATTAARSRQDLLGAMMVRAEVLTEAQLEQALEIQKRTLRRLGDVLIREGMVDRGTFREMHQLQTMETVFKLFAWKSGTYAFEQEEVDYDPDSITPINSENALMEGFRIIDEWPMVRKLITSYEMTFLRQDSSDGVEKIEELGEAGRKVYALADEGVTVQRIIDLSRLGEFETCKVLGKLMELGCLEGKAPVRSGRKVGEEKRTSILGVLRRGVAQAAVGVAVLIGIGALSYLALGSERRMTGMLVPRGGQEAIASYAGARIENAIEVFRLETGSYPDSLRDLVEVELLHPRELEYPYSEEWFYRVAEDESEGYVLLFPIP